MKNVVRVKHMDKNIREDVKRYLQLKSRKEVIEDEMSCIRTRLEEYLESLDADVLEDMYWTVSSIHQTRTNINKSKFIEVYGDENLGDVSTISSYTRVEVKRKK